MYIPPHPTRSGLVLLNFWSARVYRSIDRSIVLKQEFVALLSTRRLTGQGRLHFVSIFAFGRSQVGAATYLFGRSSTFEGCTFRTPGVLHVGLTCPNRKNVVCCVPSLLRDRSSLSVFRYGIHPVHTDFCHHYHLLFGARKEGAKPSMSCFAERNSKYISCFWVQRGTRSSHAKLRLLLKEEGLPHFLCVCWNSCIKSVARLVGFLQAALPAVYHDSSGMDL